MEQRLSGGTINLLRIARSGCQSASSFVALAQSADSFASLVYPVSAEPGAVEESTVDCLIRQLWHDPGLGRGKAVVRTMQIGDERLAVVAVPVAVNGQDQLAGILGAVDPSGRTFGMPELELLSRIARRMTSYVQARRAVRNRLIRATETDTKTASEPALDAMPMPQEPAPRGEGASEDDAGSRPASAAIGGDVPGAAVARWRDGLPAGAGAFPAFPVREGSKGSTGDRRSASLRAVDLQAGDRAPGHDEPARARQEDSFRSLLVEEEEIDGLVPLGALLGRAGRLLGAGSSMSGSLAAVAVEIEGVEDPSADRVTDVVRSIRTGLRFDDPVARIGELSFVAVVPLAPGGATAAQVEDHVSGQARAAVARIAGARVHAAHAVAPLNGGQDADELLRAAVVKLRAG